MPGKGTTSRNVRVDDELWFAAGDAAAAYGTNLAEVMRDALDALVDKHSAVGRLTRPVEVRVHVDLVPVEATP